MTSKVTVAAHLSTTKEVLVSISGEPDVTLQDGESKDFYVYDDRQVVVKEVVKES